MKKRYVLHFTTCMLLVSFHFSYGQKELLEGYIVKSEADTVYGIIEYDVLNRSQQPCLFIEGGQRKEYRTDEISGFGILSPQMVFTSQLTDTSFVEVLIRGDLSLFVRNKKYFLKKEGEEIQIFDSDEIHDQNDPSSDIYDKKAGSRWKGVLAYLTGDCNEEKPKYGDLSFKSGNLIKIVKNYNKCKGNPFDNYAARKIKPEFSYGLTFGLMVSEIGGKIVIGQLEAESDFNTSSFFLGAVFAVEPVRNLLFQSEFNFYRSNFDASNFRPSGATTSIEETLNYNFTNLLVPMYVKYNFLMSRYKLGILGGIYIHKIISESDPVFSRNLVFNTPGSPPISSFESTPSIDKKFLLNGVIGIELSTTFGELSVGANFRYYVDSVIGSTPDPNNIKLRGFQYGLVIMRKK